MMPWGKTLLMVVIKPSRETGRVPPWQGFSEVENQSPSLFKEEAQAAEKFVQSRVVLKRPLGCTSSGRETVLGHDFPSLVCPGSALYLVSDYGLLCPGPSDLRIAAPRQSCLSLQGPHSGQPPGRWSWWHVV